MRTLDLELRDVKEGCAVLGRSVGVDARRREYARHLSAGDRVLVELAYEQGLTRSQIARLKQMTPGGVSRRLKKIEERLTDPVVVALLEARDGEFSRLHRAIGIAHFLGGRSARDLGRELGFSAGQVREVIAFLRGWERGRRGMTHS